MCYYIEFYNTKDILNGNKIETVLEKLSKIVNVDLLANATVDACVSFRMKNSNESIVGLDKSAMQSLFEGKNIYHPMMNTMSCCGNEKKVELRKQIKNKMKDVIRQNPNQINNSISASSQNSGSINQAESNTNSTIIKKLEKSQKSYKIMCQKIAGIYKLNFYSDFITQKFTKKYLGSSFPNFTSMKLFTELVPSSQTYSRKFKNAIEKLDDQKLSISQGCNTASSVRLEATVNFASIIDFTTTLGKNISKVSVIVVPAAKIDKMLTNACDTFIHAIQKNITKIDYYTFCATLEVLFFRILS